MRDVVVSVTRAAITRRKRVAVSARGMGVVDHEKVSERLRNLFVKEVLQFYGRGEEKVQ